ncbi:MAG: ComEA family DNA-binding protein, partial [Bacteroidota bacterium]
MDTSSAQEEFGSDPDFEASSEMERLLEAGTQDEEEIDLADLFGRLEHQPLDLNEARVQDLEVLLGMSPFLAREIVLQRSRSAGFQSVDDLLA